MSAGNQNRVIHAAVRDIVANYIGTQGLDVTAKPYSRKISEGLEHALAPDVAGLPGVHLDVSSRLTHRLSIDLDSARRAGSINGADVSAFVQYRPERDPGESFVVLGLDQFCHLLRGDRIPPP